MTAKDIMTREFGACPPEAPLSTAIRIMADRECGFVPVIDMHGTLVGVVTDRDVCKAAHLTQRAVTHIAVSDTMSHPVYSCFVDDTLQAALVTMAKHKVRRLPVLDKKGHLQGVLSIDDIVHTSDRRGAPTSEDIVGALKAICAHRHVEVTA
jgi:CBS domain-containing protein